MGQSLVQVYIHVVWSTKHRRPLLKCAEQRQRLFAYMEGICKNQGAPPILIGGFDDHCHLLFRMGGTIELSKLLRDIKRDASQWAKRELGLRDFYWQSGYGAFSVSHSNIDAVDRYIRNQAEHHAKMSFQDEFRSLCRRHGVTLDERYVWD